MPRPSTSAAPLVAVEGVSKKFRIYHRRPAGLKERLLGWLTGRRAPFEELWALRDVSLSVARGETLGIVGANGSGKSTLLQVIAGIYTPDNGAVAVRGRLRALLELGAGFNPELSGRENVFLNGQLLGFRRPEIRRRFDAIIEFAEVERFVDMPLKTYSSGMQMRLAFAIASHLDPEILLLDEVLAVGDDHFQRKCLRRVLEIRESGAAILFISHDLATVEKLCDRVGMLEKGVLVAEGQPADVVAEYRASLAGTSTATQTVGTRWGSGDITFTRVALQNPNGTQARFFLTGKGFVIRIEYTAPVAVRRPVFGISIRAQDGTLITGPNTKMSGHPIDLVAGPGAIEYRIDRLPLLPGTYVVAAACYDEDLVHAYDHWEHCAEFLVLEGSTRERFGMITVDAAWTLEPLMQSEHRVTGSSRH